MPFMGGMEATELIRAYEMQKGLVSTPIIALTAHASEYPISFSYKVLTINFVVIGDRERCLQAGMDDHITSTLYFVIHERCYLTLCLVEPLRRADLLNAINKLAGERGAQRHMHLLRRPPPIVATYS